MMAGVEVVPVQRTKYRAVQWDDSMEITRLSIRKEKNGFVVETDDEVRTVEGEKLWLVYSELGGVELLDIVLSEEEFKARFSEKEEAPEQEMDGEHIVKRFRMRILNVCPADHNIRAVMFDPNEKPGNVVLYPVACFAVIEHVAVFEDGRIDANNTNTLIQPVAVGLDGKLAITMFVPNFVGLKWPGEPMARWKEACKKAQLKYEQEIKRKQASENEQEEKTAEDILLGE